MKAGLIKHNNKPYIIYTGENALGGREIQDGKFAQIWTPKAAKLLTKEGYKVGSLESIYHYPGPYKEPRDCQRQMVRMGLKHKRFWNLGEQRVGKTNGTIWMIDIRMRYMGLERTLIISPLYTLLKPWRNDIFSTLPHLSCYYTVQSADKAIEAITSNKYSMIVMNPAKLKACEDALIEWDPQLVVADEFMEFKSPDTVQYKCLEGIMKSERGKYRGFIPMSGTLGSQSLLDIWTSARFINPKTPDNFRSYKHKIMYRPNPYERTYVLRKGAEKYVASLLVPSVRYRTDDVNDMPKHAPLSVRVEMSDKQKRAFEKMRKQFIFEDQGRQVIAANAAVKLWKLLQIASGTVYSTDNESVILGAPGKIDYLISAMRETPAKTVIMSGYSNQQQYIAQRCRAKGFNPLVVNGKMPLKKREAGFDGFQEGMLTPSYVTLDPPSTVRIYLRGLCWYSLDLEPLQSRSTREQRGYVNQGQVRQRGWNLVHTH